MLFSLIRCKRKATLLKIATSAMAEGERKTRSQQDMVLTESAWEGGGRRHRLLAVLDHGTCHLVATGAVERERVSAHRCWERGRSGGRLAEIKTYERRAGVDGAHVTRFLTAIPCTINREGLKAALACVKEYRGKK